MDNQFETLSQAVDALSKRGYILDFNLNKDCIECKEEGLDYRPEEFHIDEFHRFEGISNPDDMSIVYAITTDDGKKGTLVDAYGTYSDTMSMEMIRKMKIH